MSICVLFLGAPVALGQTPSPTERSLADDDLALYRRRLVEVYEVRGKKDPAWDVDAIKCLELACRYGVGVPDAPPAREVYLAGNAAIKKGCDDPAVLAATGSAKATWYQASSSRDLLSRGIAGMPDLGYGPLQRAVYAMDLAQLEAIFGKNVQADDAVRMACDALTQVISEAQLDGSEPRHIWSAIRLRIDGTLTSEHARTVVDRIRATGDRVPWLTELATGALHVRLGWEARGKKFAPEVSPEGWRGFEWHLGIARDHLERAYALRPDRPEPTKYMILIAMAGQARDGETARHWFDKGVAAQFDYSPAYDSYLWSLRPRWGGSHEQMVDFGRQCAQSDRFDTVVPHYLLHAVRDVCADIEEFNFMRKQPGLSAELVRVAQAYIEAAASARKTEHRWRSHAAVILWRAGRYVEARQELAALRTPAEFDVDAASYWHTTKEEVHSEVGCLASTFADMVEAANRAETAGDLTRARELLELALHQWTKPAARRTALLEQAALADRLSRARFLESFATGGWTAIPTEPGFHGWRSVRGILQSGQPDSLSVQTRKDGVILLWSAPIGSRWEATMDADLSDETLMNGANGGFIFGYEAEAESPWYRSFLAFRRDKIATIAQGFSRRQNKAEIPDVGNTVRLRLEVFDNAARASVDGRVIYNGPVPQPENASPPQNLGVGGWYIFDQGRLIFRDLKVRRLGERPADFADVP